MEIFIVIAVNNTDNIQDIVGIYSTFDKAVLGADAHKAWFKCDREYWINATLVDYNLDKSCARHCPFKLSIGTIPSYLLRGSEFMERFSEPKE